MLNLIVPKNKLPRPVNSNFSGIKSNKNNNGCKMTSIMHVKLSTSLETKRKAKRPGRASRESKDR